MFIFTKSLVKYIKDSYINNIASLPLAQAEFYNKYEYFTIRFKHSYRMPLGYFVILKIGYVLVVQ